MREQMTNEQAKEILKEHTEYYALNSTFGQALDVAIRALGDGWVSVEERLPEVGQRVDLWLVPEDEEKSRRFAWRWEEHDSAKTIISGCRISHWIAISPPNPKQ